jgi:drug/metabolite transporter (DMT)-like permease
MEKNSRQSYIYALLAVLLWSTVATAFKLTLKGMDNAQLLFYSSLSSLLVLFVAMIRSSPLELRSFFKRETILRNALLGFINPFVYYLILFKAYSLLPAHEAQPINLIWPIIFSLFSFLFLKQTFSVFSAIGLLISFFGVAVIATNGALSGLSFHNLTGVALAFSSAFIWAGYWILNLLDNREESVKLFGAFFYGTFYTGVYIFLFDSFAGFDSKYFLGAVYIGLFEMGITFYFWLKALALSSDKAKISILVYFFPVISLAFIAIFLKENIPFSAITGLSLIIGGIFIQRINRRS